MQISINVWLETSVVIVTTNLKYTLPIGCSQLELTGNELLHLEKINLNKKTISEYTLSDYNKKLTIPNLPQDGELTIVTHSPIFSYEEEDIFYYANLKDLIYRSNSNHTDYTLHSIYNNADRVIFPNFFFTEYFYIFAGRFKNLATVYEDKHINIYFLYSQSQKIIYLLETIKKLIAFAYKQDLCKIVVIPGKQYLDRDCEYIINADYLPNSPKQNTSSDYKHAFKIIAEKYLHWQNIHPSGELIKQILEKEYGIYETQIDILNSINTLPIDAPNIITNPVEQWLAIQKIFETLIINLTDDPGANINNKKYAANTRALENSFILAIHDKTISLGHKARLLTMPSQEKILASNHKVSINIENLIKAYEKIEMFLAVNFKKSWINLYYQNNNTQLSYVCFKYLAKLGEFGTSYIYFINGGLEEKLNIIYILCSNYKYKSKEIMNYIPESSNNNHVYDLLNNVHNLCGRLNALNTCNFYYELFSNNLNLLHNKNGQGYATLSKVITDVDKTEHNLAIKLLSLFTNWPHMDECRYKLVEQNLIDLSFNLNTSISLSSAISEAIMRVENMKVNRYPKLILYKSFQERQDAPPLKAINPRIQQLKLTSV